MICAEAAHIYTDECGAPEKFTGCKLYPIPTVDGKLTVEAVSHAYHGIGDQHHVQPKVSRSPKSRNGHRLYAREVKALARFAHDHGMFLHMDGARIANAAASMGLTLRQCTRDLGVDVLSFGGTKNGLMGAEAVVFFHQKSGDKRLSGDFLYLRKQGMQLSSKMRFISVAVRNSSFQRSLAKKRPPCQSHGQVAGGRTGQNSTSKRSLYPVEANGVFARIPRHAIAKIKKRYFFYVWDEEQSMVRWMCSFDTTEQDVKQFAKFVAQSVNG